MTAELVRVCLECRINYYAKWYTKKHTLCFGSIESCVVLRRGHSCALLLVRRSEAVRDDFRHQEEGAEGGGLALGQPAVQHQGGTGRRHRSIGATEELEPFGEG